MYQGCRVFWSVTVASALIIEATNRFFSQLDKSALEKGGMQFSQDYLSFLIF